MLRQEIIDYCLTLPGAYEDYPFDSVSEPGRWTVMRHRTNRKTFALIYVRLGHLCVNVKCDPSEAELLRDLYAGVTSGYHMNKDHWNTILVGSDVPDPELLRQVRSSYDLVKPKTRSTTKQLSQGTWSPGSQGT